MRQCLEPDVYCTSDQDEDKRRYGRQLNESESLDSRDIQAIDAAKLYYSGFSQEEVAEELHVARPTVSKLLTHAKRRGFVRVQVIDPREHDERLAETLTERYGLLELVLVSPTSSRADVLRESLGQAGATLLKKLVRDGDMIGVVPSRTVAAIAERLGHSPRQNVSIVQVSNGLESPGEPFGPSVTCQRLAQAFDARCYSLSAPTFLSSVERLNRAMQVPQIRHVMSLANQARTVLYTVGDFESNRGLIAASPLAKAERDHLASRSVGDICTRFVDERGRVCLPDFNNRTLGLTLPELRAKEHKILVAGGPSKVDIIKAALVNGYVNRLVTDTHTARLIAQSSDRFQV